MAHPPEDADRGYSSGLSDLLAQSVEQQVAEQRALQTALAQVAAVLPRLGDLDPARLHAAIRDSVQQAVQDSVRQVVSATVAVEVRAALAPLADELKQELAQLQENDRSREQLAEIAESTADASADAEETLEKIEALTQQVEGLKTEFLEGLMGIRATAEGVRVDIAEATEGTHSSMQDLLQRGAGGASADAGAVWDDIRDGLAGVRTDLDQMPPAVAAAVGGRLAESLEGLRVAVAAGSSTSSDADPALVAEVAALRRDVATLRLLLVEQPGGSSPVSIDGGSLPATEARLRRYVDDAVVQLAALLLGVEAPPVEPLPEPAAPEPVAAAEPIAEPGYPAPGVFEPPAAPALAEPDLEPLELEEGPWLTADPADLGESAPAEDLAHHAFEPAEFEPEREPDLEPEPPTAAPVPSAAPAAGPLVNEFMPYLNDESPYLNDEFEWQPLPPTSGSPSETQSTASVDDASAHPPEDPAPSAGVDVGRAPRRSGGHDITGPIELDRLRADSPPPDPATVRDLPPPDDLEPAGEATGENPEGDDDGGRRRWWKRHDSEEK